MSRDGGILRRSKKFRKLIRKFQTDALEELSRLIMLQAGRKLGMISYTNTGNHIPFLLNTLSAPPISSACDSTATTRFLSVSMRVRSTDEKTSLMTFCLDVAPVLSFNFLSVGKRSPFTKLINPPSVPI